MLSNINNKYLVKIKNNRKACKLYRLKTNEIGSNELYKKKKSYFICLRLLEPEHKCCQSVRQCAAFQIHD